MAGAALPVSRQPSTRCRRRWPILVSEPGLSMFVAQRLGYQQATRGDQMSPHRGLGVGRAPGDDRVDDRGVFTVDVRDGPGPVRGRCAEQSRGLPQATDDRAGPLIACPSSIRSCNRRSCRMNASSPPVRAASSMSARSARRASVSRGSAVDAARRTAGSSSARRTAKMSAMSADRGNWIRNPWRASNLISPTSSRRSSASRTGVRDTPSDSAELIHRVAHVRLHAAVVDRRPYRRDRLLHPAPAVRGERLQTRQAFSHPENVACYRCSMLRVIDAETLAGRLAAAGVDDVRTDGTTRAIYSSDASLYRVPPLLVAAPRNADEVAAVLAVCRAEGVPLTARGAGTSIAGNAVGTGVVLDFSRHMNRVLTVDPVAATAIVQPGVVQEALQRAAAPYGLRFGPDPSTSTRCTIGGMIGNNACGSRALGYGRTSGQRAGLDVLTGTGESLRLGVDGDSVATGCAARVAPRRPGDHPHRVRPVRPSGVRLRAGAPAAREAGFDVTRLLVGSEGTLAVVTEATVRLVADARAPPTGRARLSRHRRGRRRDPAVLAARTRPPARASIRASSMSCATRRGAAARCRRCRAGRPGCSSRSPATTPPRRSPRPPRRSATTAARWTRWSSPTPARPPRCGGSARTAPGWPAAAPPGCPPTPAGRTPPCRRPCWATTCATSTR